MSLGRGSDTRRESQQRHGQNTEGNRDQRRVRSRHETVKNSELRQRHQSEYCRWSEMPAKSYRLAEAA